MVAMLGTYINWVTSVVNVTVSLGWKVFRRSPLRLFLSVTTTLVQEGFKVKVSTWINKQHWDKKYRLLSGINLTLKKTMRWAKNKRKAGPQSESEEVYDVVAIDAGMKYKELARRRLEVAKRMFEAAAVELREAERGVKDAEKYVTSLKSHCDHIAEHTAMGCDCISDAVLIEHARQPEIDAIMRCDYTSDVVVIKRAQK